MSSNITFNGVTYSIPADGDFNWGPQLTAYFIAIASGALQKTGGTFTLTSEVNFGATYGVKSPYLKSQAANPSSTGVVRLGSAQSVSWRNNANNADLALTTDASDNLLYNSKNVLFSGLGLIVNADVSNSAAIAYSKLNLATSIVNADISASAAIAYSKLNLATSVVNGDIAAAAAIAYSKLAALTDSRLLVSDGSGFVSASAVTSTEAGYLSGVTSAIQTQINTKAPSASPTFTGTVTLPATVTGASAQVLTLPTSTSSLATLALAETLSSKTLTSPQINGLYLARSNKTANYTLVLTDDIVTCDATSAAFTITFPSAATSTSKVFSVKKTDTSFNAVTLSGTGMTTNFLMTVGETARFISDGSTWIQIDRVTNTAWISFTPTGSWSTNTTYAGMWRRVGDSIQMQGLVSTSGAPTAASLTVNIVNSAGWTIDTAKLAYANANNDNLGQTSMLDSGVQNYNGTISYSSTTAFAILVFQAAATFLNRSPVSNTVPITFGASDTVSFITTFIPITNFSP